MLYAIIIYNNIFSGFDVIDLCVDDSLTCETRGADVKISRRRCSTVSNSDCTNVLIARSGIVPVENADTNVCLNLCGSDQHDHLITTSPHAMIPSYTDQLIPRPVILCNDIVRDYENFSEHGEDDDVMFVRESAHHDRNYFTGAFTHTDDVVDLSSEDIFNNIEPDAFELLLDEISRSQNMYTKNNDTNIASLTSSDAIKVTNASSVCGTVTIQCESAIDELGIFAVIESDTSSTSIESINPLGYVDVQLCLVCGEGNTRN